MLPAVKNQLKIKLFFFFYRATVAQEYGKFWVGIESEVVEVVQKGGGGPTISTTRSPVTSTTPDYIPPVDHAVSDILVRNHFFLIIVFFLS